MNSKIDWLNVKHPATIQDIAYIETVLNIKLPADYIAIAQYSHGGRPSKIVFSFEGHKEAVFDHLLTLTPHDDSSILAVRDYVRDRLVDGVYPFADDPFGNLICFDYRGESDAGPTVAFWDHELAYIDPLQGVSAVCKSFTDLLSMLTEAY